MHRLRRRRRRGCCVEWPSTALLASVVRPFKRWEQTLTTTTLQLVRLIWSHPANCDSRIRALLKATAWQTYKRTVKRPITIKGPGPFVVRCHPDNEDSGRYIYFNGLSDYDELTFLRRYLRPGDNFIDGGAHTGIYTLLAASLIGSGGHVDAFEAAPKALALLAENVALNGFGDRVDIHSSALADRAQRLRFVIDRGAGAGNRIQTADDVRNATVEVAAVALDDIATGSDYAMGKLDVEGAEGLVLQGAERLLSARTPPVWELELVDKFVARFGWTAHGVAQFLLDRDYEMAKYDARSNTLRFGQNLVGAHTNLLAIARPHKSDVVDRLNDATSRERAVNSGRPAKSQS